MLTTPRIVAVVLVVAVAFGAWRLLAPRGEEVSEAVGDAGVALVRTPDTARFEVAAVNLELQHRTTGSYAGAAVPEGAMLVRADATSYCVQTAPPASAVHLAGPGGTPAPGPC